jgi:mono/diheme cytochrome c family protein
MRHEVTFPSRVSRQGFALAKVRVAKAKGSDVFEERILAPHMAVATGDATVRSTGYGGGGLDEAENVPSEMFDIDVVDASKRTRTTGLSSRVAFQHRIGPEACRLPRAAVVAEAHQRLFVTCLGVDKVMEYDASSTTPAGGFRRAIDVASGPTGIAIDPTTEQAVVWSSFDRVVSLFSLAEPVVDPKDVKARKAKAPPPVIEVIKLAPPSSPLSTEAALGEKLFHKAGSAKISKDGRACASCHPDGRDDGLVWSTPDGPRQTIFLAGRVEREAPYGWLGKHGSLKEHITVTMKNLKGSGASDEELGALVAWLRAMKAPPRAKAAAIGAKEQHGRELFNSSALQCGTCHAEKTGFSDHESHDVASATGADVSRQFLVPSLRFVAGSGPYFHDGRYASLGELLQKNDRMGDTKSLSQDDRDALEAYLRTL